MSSSIEFVAHCVDLLSTLGHARAKRMFGGHGVYVDDLFVALIISEQLYLKADAETRAAFERVGSRPFEYARKDGLRAVMAYWTAPDEAMESAALMQPWLRLALGAAMRAAHSKRPAKPPAQSLAPPAGRSRRSGLARRG